MKQFTITIRQNDLEYPFTLPADDAATAQAFAMRTFNAMPAWNPNSRAEVVATYEHPDLAAFAATPEG